jgi:hypothetical protein
MKKGRREEVAALKVYFDSRDAYREIRDIFI